MSAPASLCDHSDPAAFAQAALRRQVERLDELAEQGLRMARLICDQVSADPAAAPAGCVTAFTRVAKAVRLTGLLQSRLIKDFERLRAGALAPLAEGRARPERIVERQAQAWQDDDEDDDDGEDEDTEDKIERLEREAAERLDDEDIYRQVATRPVGELVALICRDLGLDPDWNGLSQEAWAQAAPSRTGGAARASPIPEPDGAENPLADPGAQPRQEQSGAGQGGLRPPVGASQERPDSEEPPAAPSG